MMIRRLPNFKADGHERRPSQDDQAYRRWQLDGDHDFLEALSAPRQLA
jgi:hypothetical protein